MIAPPPAAGRHLEAVVARPLGTQKAETSSSHVKVVNSVWNGSGYIKRKKAARYVEEGRGVFVGPDEFRLIERHSKNMAAAASAARCYDSINVGFEWTIGRSDGSVVKKAQKGKQMESAFRKCREN